MQNYRCTISSTIRETLLLCRVCCVYDVYIVKSVNQKSQISLKVCLLNSM